MPSKNTYVVDRKRYKKFSDAAARAVDLSLERDEGVVIVEHGQTGTYAITVRAQAEEIAD